MNESTDSGEKQEVRAGAQRSTGMRGLIGALVVLLIVGAIAFAVFNRVSAGKASATNQQWENYLKTHPAETDNSDAQRAFDERQALRAKRMQKSEQTPTGQQPPNASATSPQNNKTSGE